jgi:uncharacterized protein (DUF362 family)
LAPVAVRGYPGRSAVALVDGNDRGKNIHDALLAVDDQILRKLRTRKRVVIKPNNVSTEIQLASTHADTLRAVLEYLGPRFKGPIAIAEASAGDTWTGFRNFRYTDVAREYKSMQVELVDLNEEARYEQFPLLDGDLHPVPVRLAARLVDPDTFVISTAILKAHNYYVATLSVKNMVLGAPLHNAPQETQRWSDKRRFHAGYHVGHYNMLTTAQALQPHWGVAVIDGFEGMEGNGPIRGTAVPSRVAIASTDFIAADRVGVECMGLDPRWVGYLQYCGQVGAGNYDLAKIDVLGASIPPVRRTYRLHDSIERQLQWMGPSGLTSPA